MSEKHRRIPELYAMEHRHDSLTTVTPTLSAWTSPVVRKNDVNSDFIAKIDSIIELDSSECATVRNLFNRTVEKDFVGHSN